MKPKFYKFICLYEIIGGILGLLLAAYLMLFTANPIFDASIPFAYRLYSVLIYVFVLAFYAISVIAGLHLWKEKRTGFTLSLIVQALQIPYLIVPGFIYSLISGIRLGAAVKFGPDIFFMSALLDLGSTFHIYFGGNVGYTAIGVNVLSIVVVSYLLRFRRSQEQILQAEESPAAEEITDEERGSLE